MNDTIPLSIEAVIERAVKFMPHEHGEAVRNCMEENWHSRIEGQPVLVKSGEHYVQARWTRRDGVVAPGWLSSVELVSHVFREGIPDSAP